MTLEVCTDGYTTHEAWTRTDRVQFVSLELVCTGALFHLHRHSSAISSPLRLVREDELAQVATRGLRRSYTSNISVSKRQQCAEQLQSSALPAAADGQVAARWAAQGSARQLRWGCPGAGRFCLRHTDVTGQLGGSRHHTAARYLED